VHYADEQNTPDIHDVGPPHTVGADLSCTTADLSALRGWSSIRIHLLMFIMHKERLGIATMVQSLSKSVVRRSCSVGTNELV